MPFSPATNTAQVVRACTPASLILVVLLPLVFLHPMYQPSRTTGGVTWNLTDVAIAIVVSTALARTAVRSVRETLARAWPVWVTLGAFLGWALMSLAWGRANDPGYELGTRLVSALKLFEFALLAPAVVALVRSTPERRALIGGLSVWTAFLSIVALLQFLGLINEFDGRRPLQREPSYIGVHELGAISAATLSVSMVALLAGRWRGEAKIALGAGSVGVALAAALDAVGGTLAAGAVVAAATARRGATTLRRVLLLGALLTAIAVASVTLRASAVSAFLQLLGVRPASQQTTTHVESYAHRTLLGYIGLRIWLDHPIVGAGWQESLEPGGFEPYLAAAHRRFPNEPPAAFPSPEHRWGVQNGLIQTLSDLGLIGLALLAGALAAGARFAWRAASQLDREVADVGAIALGWLITSSAVFVGTGLLPGSSVEALLWLSLGLSASLASPPRSASDGEFRR